MSLLTIPNVFANGTGPANIIDAVQMNANFTAVQTAVNNIYPSQILPITTGQATFGATATGVGYKFLANDATATPLTVAGVAGQSADILDVTTTSGGTKTFSISSGGQVLIPQAANGPIIGSSSAYTTLALQIFSGGGANQFTQLYTNSGAAVQGVNATLLGISNESTNLLAFSRGGSIGLAGGLGVGGNINIVGAAASGGAGTVTLGGTTSNTGTAGGTQAVPVTVLGYLIAFVGTTQVKIPYFSA